ncbi:hypothetical protein IFT75_02760 [Pseudomonas sp. CFBP 8758]|uniref:hypothetical protein n=1 Tax=Pseudomonas sp. CFBP 8758 TaxID=2775286 RepID=UPI001782AF85|nr:hypothetical protein [Pseudomonas sp. CFBP 8758]MBD8592321.1 hypothetical protein [Pseudomonas sp. CFBP 8758]
MDLFLYLKERSWAEPWINGGAVPINPARFYRSETRAGVLTPDENFTIDSNFDIAAIPAIDMSVSGGAVISNLSFVNCTYGKKSLPNLYLREYSHWDGWIMCFCSVQSKQIAKRFGGKKACVQIVDFGKLKESLDTQLGDISQGKYCKYTSDHQRGPFLKSRQDEWQSEYRLFWNGLHAEKRCVQIPSGVGKLVGLY